MTVPTRLALEINAAQRTGDMLLTTHLVQMKRIVILKVQITDLTVIVLGNLVLLEIASLSEETATAGKWALDAFALESG